MANKKESQEVIDALNKVKTDLLAAAEHLRGLSVNEVSTDLLADDLEQLANEEVQAEIEVAEEDSD